MLPGGKTMSIGRKAPAFMGVNGSTIILKAIIAPEALIDQTPLMLPSHWRSVPEKSISARSPRIKILATNLIGFSMSIPSSSQVVRELIVAVRNLGDRVAHALLSVIEDVAHRPFNRDEAVFLNESGQQPLANDASSVLSPKVSEGVMRQAGVVEKKVES